MKFTNPDARKSRRRWLSFTLRTLLLLMLAFGVWIGWVAYLEKESDDKSSHSEGSGLK